MPNAINKVETQQWLLEKEKERGSIPAKSG